MSYDFSNFGVVDTEVSGVKAATIEVPTLNWEADYAILDNSKAGSVKLVNTTTPLDQKETIRFSISQITDAYKGTSIPVEYQEPVKTGTALLAQITETSKVTDSNGHIHYCPESIHIVHKSLNSAYMPATDPDLLLARLIGALYHNGSSRFKTMLKGAILPKGL